MTKRVIVVDDSPVTVKILSAFFSKTLGYEVVASGGNGEEAIALFNEHKPDLITLDMSMPIMDGSQALVEILNTHPQARIMMISASQNQEVTECLRKGAKTYMEKPIQVNNEAYLSDFKASLEEAFAN